jgi:ketosteroid isomerase-like protein
MSHAAVEVAVAFIRAFEAKDREAMTDLLAEDVVFESPRATVTGAAAVAEVMGGFAQAVGGVDVIAAYGDDERAVVMYGMKTGPFGTVRAADTFVVRDGKIVSDRLVFDTYELRRFEEAQAPKGPALGSVLLASRAPEQLRAWYEQALEVRADHDGFLQIGEVGLLVDGRDDVAARPVEPARVILNVHVDDARATARHLDDLGVTWVAPLEYRDAAGAWFGTVLDPDGNYLQVIELTEAYWAARQERAGAAGR